MAAQVLVVEVVAVREDVETRPLLLLEQRGERVAELLAEDDVLHARGQRPPRHSRRVPARPRPRAGDRGRQQNVLRRGEHARPPSQTVCAAARGRAPGLTAVEGTSPRSTVTTDSAARWSIRRMDATLRPATWGERVVF